MVTWTNPDRLQRAGKMAQSFTKTFVRIVHKEGSTMTETHLKRIKRRIIDYIRKTQDVELVLRLAGLCKVKTD